MTLREMTQNKHDEITRIGRKYGVVSIKLFGSAARGEETSQSDLDFLVELETGRSLFDLGGFQVELEEFLKRKVDVVTLAGLRDRLRPVVLKEAIPV